MQNLEVLSVVDKSYLGLGYMVQGTELLSALSDIQLAKAPNKTQW